MQVLLHTYFLVFVQTNITDKTHSFTEHLIILQTDEFNNNLDQLGST